MAALLGKKVGMTQVFTDEGSVERVTVVEAGPCHVTQLFTRERDGFDAVQLGFEETTPRKLTKAERGHLQKAGAPALRRLRQVRDEGEDLSIGDVVTCEVFQPGQRVKVSGTSKGKGFQGTVKRHNFARGPESHGSHSIRAPGAIGASATPSRTFKGMRGPGQMGAGRVTQKGLTVVDVLAERNLLLLRGSVPGPNGGAIEITSEG